MCITLYSITFTKNTFSLVALCPLLMCHITPINCHISKEQISLLFLGTLSGVKELFLMGEKLTRIFCFGLVLTH